MTARSQDSTPTGEGSVYEDGKGNVVDGSPVWDKECYCCGAVPVHPITKMCGPCTFGEAETAGGNW